MKHYILTLLKDIPEGEAGYSNCFDETVLESYWYNPKWTALDYALMRLHNNSKFVKKEDK